ncbi:MAG: D-glycero-beta-D-manno-heptose-7-phosphate kinase [Halobacteriovoraceae bacterium]|nr:D-glycero-beta-D-manno-heptose-7-phosphate kinase [Halobacteriovoraceae bacterium]
MNIISKERLNEITSKFKDIRPLMVVGDVGVDKYTLGDVNKISPEAPVPVVEVFKEWKILGLAANISNNLIELGVEGTLFGIIGNDSAATFFESLLEEKGLKTWGIVREDGRPTTWKERVTTNMQQICRVDFESKEAISEDTLKKVVTKINELSSQHGAIILQDYGKGMITKELAQNLIGLGREQGRLVAVDPSRTTGPLVYKGAHLLKPNRLESKLMIEYLGYRYESVQKTAEILADKLDLNKVVITLGGEGMALYDKEKGQNTHFIPTVASEVFDVSGAGDTVISLLVSSLEAGATLEEAAWVGNCGAGVVVAKKGTATVSREELKNYHDLLIKKIEHE